MSNITDDTEERDNIRELRAQAARAKELEAQLTEANKRAAFAEAGIDPGSKLGALLFRTWDGTDTAALRTEATELGYYGQQTPAAPRYDQAEVEQQRLRQQLAGGQMPTPDIEGPDPVDTAIAEYHDGISKGRRPEVMQLETMQKFLAAGKGGDRRILFDQNRHTDEALRTDQLLGITYSP